MAKTDRSTVSKRKRAANSKGRTLRASKRAKSSAPSTLTATDHRLSNLPFIPLLKIMRFLDAPSLEKIRCGSRSLNEFVVLNRSRLVWRRVRNIRMTRSFDLEQKIIYNVEILPETVSDIYPKRQDFCKTECTKGSPSTSFALMWLATKFPNFCIEELDLRLFCFDQDDLHEAAQTMVERKLRIEKLILQSSDVRVHLTSFIRFLNTISPLAVSIFQIRNREDLQSLSFDDTFFTYMAKLASLEIRDYSRPMMPIPVPVIFDKIPKKFYTYGVFLMPLSTVLNAIRDWYGGCEEFGDWCITVSRDECSNLKHLAMATEIKRLCRVTDKAKKLTISNRGGKKIRVRTTICANRSNYVVDPTMWLKIERY